jgi:hypothetical protein
MWRTPAHTIGPGVGQFDFEQLAERGERQRQIVAELHLEAAKRALPS